MKKILYYFLPVASMLLPAACTTEEDFGGGTVPPGDGFTIEAVCQNMLPQQVVTRSAIAKDDKEKRINQLYLFFFDENGDYLESSNTKVFSPYMAPSANTTNVSIPTDVFKDPAFAKKTTIYALANVTPEVVTDANGDGYPDNFPQYSKDGKKAIEGNLLFAHKGFSGPAVLTSSLYWEKGKIQIDFLPKDKIEKFLIGNRNISTALPLPKRFIQEFLSSVDLEDKSCSKLTQQDLEKLKLLKNYELSPAGNFGYTKAEVTKGGIDTNEINHNSFESLKQKDLYFIGECLDLTGELGGFNFQIVFSQAFICANHLNKN